MFFTRYLSPIFISLFLFEFSNSLPTVDQNPSKKPKFDHPQSNHSTSPIYPLQSSEEINNLPQLPSTEQPSNLPQLTSTNQYTDQSTNLTLLPSTQQSIPLLTSQQMNHLLDILSTPQASNVPSLLPTQQPSNLPSLLSSQQHPIESIELAQTLRSNLGQCLSCLKRDINIYPDCYQCLSKKENTKSHEFCINCIVKTKECPLCKATVTSHYHYMVLLKKKSQCDHSIKYHTFQSCLSKLLRDCIITIGIYPHIRSSTEELIKYCILHINGNGNTAFEFVLENYNVLSMELIDFLIPKYGIKESYSDYIDILIKKCFGLQSKIITLDIEKIVSIVQKYGNVTDYSKYNKQAIKSSLEWALPNLSSVSRFISYFGNQLSDHQLLYESALEASIRDHDMKAFSQLILHFGLDKNNSSIRTVIKDSMTYSFHIRNFRFIQTIISKYGKIEVIDYLKLVIELMIKHSFTTQTNGLFDKFASASDFPILVNHAIILSIQRSKLDVVEFIIFRYGKHASYNHYIFLAIHTSVLLSKSDIIQDFIQIFGNQDQFNEYFESAITSCLFYSNFKLISQFKTKYGNGITDEAFIIKAIHLGIRSEFYTGLKVFIKEFGNPLDYLDYFLLLESMKGNEKDENIDEIINYFMAFYFNE